MGGPAYVNGQVVGELDNFYTCTVVDKCGHRWTSAEHLYQASKFRDPAYRADIRRATASHGYYRMGQSRQHALIDKFEEHKGALMFVANWYKYSQNAHLARILLATAPHAIECRASTPFWNAENARILADIRAVLQERR